MTWLARQEGMVDSFDVSVSSSFIRKKRDKTSKFGVQDYVFSLLFTGVLRRRVRIRRVNTPAFTTPTNLPFTLKPPTSTSTQTQTGNTPTTGTITSSADSPTPLLDQTSSVTPSATALKTKTTQWLDTLSEFITTMTSSQHVVAESSESTSAATTSSGTSTVRSTTKPASRRRRFNIRKIPVTVSTIPLLQDRVH